MPLGSLDETQLEQIADHVAAALAHQRQPRSPWDRRWNVITSVIAVAAFIFTVGVNWSRMDANERKIDRLDKQLERNDTDVRELRNELANERTANLVVNSKLDAIQYQVADVKARFDKAFR